jgi:hypothetical protein
MHSCLFYITALLSICGYNGNIANLTALQHNALSDVRNPFISCAPVTKLGSDQPSNSDTTPQGQQIFTKASTHHLPVPRLKMGRPKPPLTPPHAVMTSTATYFCRGQSVVFNELQDKQIVYSCRQISVFPTIIWPSCSTFRYMQCLCLKLNFKFM